MGSSMGVAASSHDFYHESEWEAVQRSVYVATVRVF